MKVDQSFLSADRPSLRSTHPSQQGAVPGKMGAHLVVPLFQSGLGEAPPTIGPVNSPGGLEGNVQIATLNSKVKPSVLVLHKMECNLLWDVRSIEASGR